MTPEKQRIAIAEACGLTDVRMEEGENVDIDAREIYAWNELRGTLNGERVFVRSYLTDLNAMHEAEKTLDDDQWVTYGRELSRLNVFPMVHATAAQRCEAFLRTIGKWEEDK